MVLKVFTPDEITAHNNADEPWIVIHDRVYSVKHLLAEHPGGERILIQNAGEDATEAFEAQKHSENARKWMKDFEIGVVAGSKLAKELQPKWYEKKGLVAGGVLVGLAVVAGTAAIIVHQVTKN